MNSPRMFRTAGVRSRRAGGRGAALVSVVLGAAGLAAVGTPALAPDGQAVAVEVTTYHMDDNNSTSDIWLLSIDGLAYHDYGKEPRPGRKVGHCTILKSRATERNSALADALRSIQWT